MGKPKHGRYSSKADRHTDEGREQLLSELANPNNRRPLPTVFIRSATDDFLKFCDWISTVEDTKEAVLLVNENPDYRVHLVCAVIAELSQIDFTRLSEEALMFYIQCGAQNFRVLKKYSGWDWEAFKQPLRQLLPKFIDEQVLVEPDPLSTYFFIIFSIYLWKSAQAELEARAKKNPEVNAFLDYVTATNPEIREIEEELSSKSPTFPSVDEAWRELSGVPRIEKGVQGLAGRYADIFSLQSKHDGVLDDVLKESLVEVEEKLFDNVNEMKDRAYDAYVDGLKGYLGKSLLLMTANDMIDAVRRERSLHKRYEITESQIDTYQQAHDKEGEVNTPFLDTLPSQEEMPEEPLDLESLGFDKDELTPKELLLLDELADAESKGFARDSKQGLSLRQYWGKDYGRKIKAFKRLEAKRKKP